MDPYAGNPVIVGLRELYNASPEARQILTHFSGWKEDRKVTAVKRVHRMLSRDGSTIERQQIALFFQHLHKIGLGEFIVGDDGRRPRFVWGYPLRQLSQVATGDAWELKPLPDLGPTNGHENSGDGEGGDGEGGDSGESDEILDSGEPLPTGESTKKGASIKHSFRLREDLSVKFRLPRDLTMTEAVRLAEYIKTLPFGA